MAESEIRWLATAMQNIQSAPLRATVPNARCRNGTYTTSTWRATDAKTAAHSHPFAKRCRKALRSSDRAFTTLKI